MTNDARLPKLNLVATVMVGILAASVVLAWTTTRTHKATTSGGAGIISKLTDDTLDSYWTTERKERWFIGKKKDVEKIDWTMRSSGLKSPGVFSGYSVLGNPGGSPSKGEWTIRTDLSSGYYVGRNYGPDEKPVSETHITLTKTHVAVTVIHNKHGRRFNSTSPRPKDYMPEGTFHLIMGLVAAGGEEVRVKMILDDHAITRRGSVNFVDVRLIPLRNNVVRVRAVRPRLMATTDYHLDSNHNVYRYEYPDMGLVYRMEPRQSVMETFGMSEDEPAVRSAP
jgi:hypothetical protein